MRTLNKLSAFTLILLIAGCAAWAPAQTFEQKLAYAYSTHTAVLNTAADGVERGTLSKEDGISVLKLADESRALLDAARLSIGVGDVSTAEGQLALAVNVLTQLQTYLRSRGLT